VGGFIAVCQSQSLGDDVMQRCFWINDQNINGLVALSHLRLGRECQTFSARIREWPRQFDEEIHVATPASVVGPRSKQFYQCVRSENSVGCVTNDLSGLRCQSQGWQGG